MVSGISDQEARGRDLDCVKSSRVSDSSNIDWVDDVSCSIDLASWTDGHGNEDQGTWRDDSRGSGGLGSGER